MTDNEKGKVYVILHASRQPFISLGVRFGGIKLQGREYTYLQKHDAFLRIDFVKKYNKHMKGKGSWEDFANEIKKVEMSKVITFSRQFQKGHPREGQPTYFVEKIWSEIGIKDNQQNISYDKLMMLNKGKEKEARLVFHSLTQPFNFTGEKKHTIRAGNRFKAGDKFSPRIWSGKLYCSKQIIIAPDIEIKKTWDYEVKLPKKGVEQWLLNGTVVSENNEYMRQWFNANLIIEIAKNDGLEITDLLDWFKHPKPFTGQIICWDESVNY